MVTLITIHSAKGAEQKVCYVPHVSPNQYPYARAQGDFDDVEEERRVLYVALTRAENELILTKQNLNTWSQDTYDEQGRKIESYFLNDLPSHLVQAKFIGKYLSNLLKTMEQISCSKFRFWYRSGLNYCIRRCDYLNVYWPSLLLPIKVRK